MIVRLVLMVLACTAFSAVPGVASAGASAGTPGGPGAVLRGVSTRFEFAHEGCELRAKPLDLLRAPLSLSIRPADGVGVWSVEVVGIVPGVYNLADFIECADGNAVGLAPMTLEVVSALPPGRHLDLALTPRRELAVHPRSSVQAIVALGAWGALTVGWIAVRLSRRVPREEACSAEATPTDPHLLLIEAIDTRPMTIPERGRLELLTLRALGERYLPGCPDSPVELISQLRRDPDASAIVEALEGWLHRPNATGGEAGTLRELLKDRFFPGGEAGGTA